MDKSIVLNVVKSLLFLLFSGSCLLQDLKKKSISERTFRLFALPGALLRLYELSLLWNTGGDKEALKNCLMCFILPALLIIISYLTMEAIGRGDGLYFLVSALYLSPGENLCLFIFAAAFAALAGLFVIAFGKAEKKRLPFMAFVFPKALQLGLTGIMAVLSGRSMI